MCGIAGIVEHSVNQSKISQSILKSMSDVIIHRGPDSEGQWISDNKKCGLTFRRLSIIDLSEAGNQPMISTDGKYTIVFNGEIYNHLELREQLIKKGYKYHSRTDTETILNGFIEWGPEILDKMIGMWSFAIWDNEKQELFASRDRIGIKPFYFYHQNGRFIFASEIKSILQHPAVLKEINFDELPNYLNFGMTSNKNSLFKNIHKLPSGNYLKLNKSGNIEIKRYWSPFPKNKIDLNAQQIQKELISKLRLSIKDRMMSDVPFGVFLSGGIDSSLNVALMSELMDRPVDTFSVGFKQLEQYNELEYARKIAKLFKTNHHEILINDRDAFPILEDLVWYEDEPNADPVCIPLFFLSKLTRNSGTIVIQVGEGSDEQFCGYKWMIRDYFFYKSYWKYFKSNPKIIRKLIYHTSKPFFRFFHQPLALEYLRRASYDNEFYWSGVSVIPPIEQDWLSVNAFLKTHIPEDYALRLHNEAKSLNSNADYFQRMQYLELQHRLAETLLMRVDKITMANSIEARVPFLDHRIVEFSMSTPESIKIPDKINTKIILKKAVEGILPNEIIYRKKQGFAAPVNEWLGNQWYDYAENEILNSYFVKEKIFDKSYLKKLLNLHKSSKKNLGNQIYLLLMLALWQKRFF